MSNEELRKVVEIPEGEGFRRGQTASEMIAVPTPPQTQPPPQPAPAQPQPAQPHADNQGGS